MRSVFIILFLYSASLHAQEKCIFYSNIEKESEFLKSKMNVRTDLQLISLGDNFINLYSEHDNANSIIGDVDFYDIVKNGEITRDGISKKSLCPGPYVEELGNKHVIIRINSNWFMDREYQNLVADYNCDVFNHIHMIEELEDLLDDYKSWNVIILAHHPIRSISELAGKGLGHLNLIPVYGQLRTSYKKYDGNEQDISHANYQKYINLMDQILDGRENIAYITGHDRINSVLQKGGLTHINVNTGDRKYKFKKDKFTQFVSDEPSVLEFREENDGYVLEFINSTETYKVEQLFHGIENKDSEDIEVRGKVEKETVASLKYAATGLKKFWMGEGYRKEWSAIVSAPLLSPSSFPKKLTPYALGGGLQTKSIKFEAGDGKKYAFRVLDKEPAKSLSEVARESVYKGIVQELITTMHPYGPLMANELINATDIIHIPPSLYILDDSELLSSEKYNSFIGKIGTLEEKPKGKKKKRQGYYDADKVVSTYEMLLKLRKFPEHRIDKMAYAKARLMDMYLGDWDRHEDNWKWARFDDGKESIYKPIPKDRDHVFSHWTGVIPSIADVVVVNAEDFDYKFGNLRQLNFKARFLDRQLATEISLSDWLEAASYLEETMTDEVIENALLKLPEEVRGFSGSEIVAKLKSRRSDLERAIKEYYLELSKEVHIAARNKKDLVNINILDDGNVELKISSFKNNKEHEPYYTRTFEQDLVKRICIFGLEGQDEFIISGNQESRIPIFILGGADEDIIQFSNSINEGTIEIYDANHEDKVVGANPGVTNLDRIPQYDPYSFDYNFLSPKATIRNSSGNGFGFGVGFSYFKRGFNRVDYAEKYDVLANYYPSIGAYRVDWMYTKNRGGPKYDIIASGRVSTLYDKYPFFYGIGNTSTFNRENRITENRIDYNYYDIKLGLEKKIYNRSAWTNTIDIEHHNVFQFKDVMILDSNTLGFGRETYVGLASKLNLDFTDRKAFPTNGSIFELDLAGRTSFDGNFSGNFNSRFSYFKTINLGIDATFIGSMHYKQAFGDSAFYHLSSIGSHTTLRGYTRNRFIDKHALQYNTECRLNLGSIKTPLIRFHIGVFGFYDGGRVWNNNSDFNVGEWNNSYGGGVILWPGTTDFSLSYIIGYPEDDFTYSKFELGYDF